MYMTGKPKYLEKLETNLKKRGAYLMTDKDRDAIGLPPRGPDGWTAEEIVAFENYRMQEITHPLYAVDLKDNLLKVVVGNAADIDAA